MSFSPESVSVYDLIYAEKPYREEVQFVLDVVSDAGILAGVLLDYGCGTGRHARLFADAGWDVTGFDVSSEMLAEARAQSEGVSGLRFANVAKRAAVDSESVAVIVCFFDVLSFMTADEEIEAFFSFVERVLMPGGFLFFDFWYGPGVINLGPEKRWRELAVGDTQILRLTDPNIDWKRSLVEITHSFVACEKGGIRRFADHHSMRFFFLNEIHGFARRAGLEVRSVGSWDEPTTPPEITDWSALAVVRKGAANDST